MTTCEVIQIDKDTWRFEDGFVRFFLLTGTKQALLVDCGATVENALELARELTDLPVSLLITHADRDHIASVGEFAQFYMNPAEAVNFYKGSGRMGSFVSVEDGDVIDLGGRELEVISLPGHTPGSIALLDIDRRVLISGDPIQDGEIYLFGPYRELHAYLTSLEKAEGLAEYFDTIYPAHGTFPVEPELIGKLIEGAIRILSFDITPEKREMHGREVAAYDIGCATLLLDE